MDAHSRTLDKFSMYRPSDGALNAKYDTRSDHAYVRSVRSYRFYRVKQPDLQHIRRYASSQNVPDSLQQLHHVVASSYPARQNYRGLNGCLRGFVNPHRHYPVQSAEPPMYKVDQNSSMHSAAHPPTGRPTNSQHRKYHQRIPFLQHPHWYHQIENYTPPGILHQPQSAGKSLSHSQYV